MIWRSVYESARCTRPLPRPSLGKWAQSAAIGLVALVLVAALVAPPVLGQATKAPATKEKKDAGAAKTKKSKASTGKAKKTKKATTAPSGPDDKVIVPYIGDNTWVVARLDVAKVDAAAVEDFINRSTDEAAFSVRIALGQDPQTIATAASQGLDESAATRVRRWLERFVAAGGRYAYMLVDGDLWSPETVVVVPLRKGADAKALTELLNETNEGTGDSVAEVGKALVSTSRSKIVSINARITAAAAGGGRRGASAERPDLPAAFAVAGDAPLRVSVLPAESFRQTVGEGMMTLPDTWGGGDPKIIARGIRWATLAVAQKPSPAFTITVQAANPEEATKILQMANQGIERLKAEPAADEATKAERAKHLESFKATLQGETVVTMTLAGDYFLRGVPDVMLHAMRVRFFLADGREAGASPPPQTPPPTPAPPAAPPKPAKPATPPPPPPVTEGDGLD